MSAQRDKLQAACGLVVLGASILLDTWAVVGWSLVAVGLWHGVGWLHGLGRPQ